VPMDPLWHVKDQLRTRVVLGILIFSLTMALYHLYYRRPGARALAMDLEPAVLDAPATPVVREAIEHYTPLSLKVADRILLVEPSQIDWVEADKDYVLVHCGPVAHRVRQSITAFESRLPPATHIRVSRSAIVNLQSVKEIQPWFRGDLVLILKSGARVTTGAKYRARITSRL
jgi:DNA-binding LytR/AlgR family response regulator